MWIELRPGSASKNCPHTRKPFMNCRRPLDLLRLWNDDLLRITLGYSFSKCPGKPRCRPDSMSD